MLKKISTTCTLLFYKQSDSKYWLKNNRPELILPENLNNNKSQIIENNRSDVNMEFEIIPKTNLKSYVVLEGSTKNIFENNKFEEFENNKLYLKSKNNESKKSESNKSEIIYLNIKNNKSKIDLKNKDNNKEIIENSKFEIKSNVLEDSDPYLFLK
eukprot:GHVL01033431.1.p1 GENE.GHVL01033431.1~~GHVL01033431.1.p1  ORF type:complete len:156 (+),score=62.08 GHVL01033431.1:371-838(+)